MLLIGIAGGTGSGKTTVVNQIVNELPTNIVGVISQDSYYKDLLHMTKEERNNVICSRFFYFDSHSSTSNRETYFRPIWVESHFLYAIAICLNRSALVLETTERNA